MNLLDRYMARELIFPFLAGVAAFTAILMGSSMLFKLAKLALEGVPLGQIMRLFLLGLPAFIVLTFPMSVLFSSLTASGRLSGESEMVAMFAAGISLYRLLIPILVISLGISALTWVFNEEVVPWTSSTAAELREELKADVREQKKFLLTQYENNGLPLRLVMAVGFDPSTNTLKNVTFQQFSKGRPSAIVTAPRAVFKTEKKWRFIDATVLLIQPNNETTITRVAKIDYNIGQNPQDVKESKPKPEQMTYAQLEKFIAARRAEGLRGSEVLEYEVELQRKLALPFTCLAFAVVGTPLGIRPSRKSSGFGLGLGFSILVIFGFYVLSSYLTVLGTQGLLPPVAAAWLPNVITLILGIVLLIRAPK